MRINEMIKTEKNIQEMLRSGEDSVFHRVLRLVEQSGPDEDKLFSGLAQMNITLERARTLLKRQLGATYVFNAYPWL